MIKRIKRHKWDLRNNLHSNDHLQNAYSLYGEESFEFEVLEEYPKYLLSAMEHYWVIILNARNPLFGYNILPTHPYIQNSGHSEETREKIRLKNIGFKHSEESKIRMSKSRKGRKQNKEWAEKRAKSHRGRKRSEETKKRMRDNKPKKAITQYSLSKEFIKDWDNMECIIKELELNSSGIYQCLTNKSKKSNGYIWKYKK